MSDRGLPIVDGAQACPFVAFENDRDERGTSPDPRHRCYAEERPAPRALAHQEAYCLAPAFPACPIFQDWARREAAQARAGGSGAGPSREDQPRREQPGDWPASPQWGAGAAAGAAPGAAAAGAAGEAMYDEDDPEDENAPGYLASRSAAAGAGVGAGLAGSAADRLAGSDRGNGDVPEAPRHAADDAAGRRAARLDGVGPPDERYDDGVEEYDGPPDDDEFDSERPGRPRSARASGGIGFGRDRRPKVGDTRARGWDQAGPTWDQGRQHDPYQARRSRGPRIPRLAAMAILIVVAAIGLFLLPGLLGVGAPPPDTGDRTSSPAVSTAPSGPLEVTPLPEATPFIYIVKAGDNMSKIASQFGVTLDDLIAANRELHPNPDALQIGDEVIIPSPAPGGGASPSLVP
jgi:LysM repeat protein